MSIAELRDEPTRLKTTGKVLVIDIERLPGTAYVWEPRTRYIPPRHFAEWPRLLCFAARWYGNKTPIFEAEWVDRERMIRNAWELYDKASAVVTFNGVRFDNKHLKTDWLEAGLPPPRPWKDVDLFQQVKQFGYESKSLDTVTRRLGRGGKEMHYSIETAVAAANGDRAAQREMQTYNRGDVELTEWLYDRLRGWLGTHPFTDRADDQRCNQCGGTDLTKQPTTYRAVVIDYALFRCNNCGGLMRGGWHSRAADVRGIK